MSSDSSPDPGDTQGNYENEAFGGVGNNFGYTAPGNAANSNPTRDRGGSGAGRNLDADMAAGSNYADQFGAVQTNFGYAVDQNGNKVTSGSPATNNNDDNGPSQPAGPTQAQIDLANARDRRAAALKKKQKELSDAFGFFNDDFYDDMGQSYKDFAQGSLDSAYDDSLRGIYSGFKSRGLLTQEGVNSAIAGLNQAKADEMNRLNTLAGDYSQAKRQDVDKSRQKFGDELSSLVGGATDAESVNRQIEAIEGFDVAGRVDKLKKPNAKQTVDFFKDYDKVSPEAAAKVNVQASAAPGQVGDGGGSASSVVQMGANTAPSSMVGIRSPFQGGSTKVLS